MRSPFLPRINADERGLKHKDLAERIIGIFYDVYNELGQGFLESVYEHALLLALQQAGLSVQEQVGRAVWFRGTKIGDFKADLVVNDAVLLESKAARVLELWHEAQLLNYLRCTEMKVGLLLNFGPRPQFRRLAFANERKGIRVNPR